MSGEDKIVIGALGVLAIGAYLMVKTRKQGMTEEDENVVLQACKQEAEKAGVPEHELEKEVAKCVDSFKAEEEA